MGWEMKKKIKTRTLGKNHMRFFFLLKRDSNRDFYLKKKKDDNIKQRTFLGKY